MPLSSIRPPHWPRVGENDAGTDALRKGNAPETVSDRKHEKVQLRMKKQTPKPLIIIH
jgi:hypothetical protein